MLSYIAHIPHSPLLLKQISKDKYKQYKKTVDAIHDIADDLYSRNIDTIITITGHGTGFSEAFTINFSPKYDCDFSAFINYDMHPQFFGDSYIASVIRRKLCTRYPISSITTNYLDTASGMAMIHLSQNNKNIHVVPVTHSLDRPRKLFSFGSALRDILENIQKRVAIIGLGDLSSDKNFDSKLIDSIHDKDKKTLLAYNNNQVHPFSCCGLRPLAVLLGVIDEIRYDIDVNYEQKHGVGLMTTRFIF